MNESLKGLLTSKKFIAAIVAVIVAIGARYGLQLDPPTVGVIVSPIIAYIVGQGMADRGKEAAAINATASIDPVAASNQRSLKENDVS
jgi:hypothetical protein